MNRRGAGDQGFGLLETLMAVAVISVTMAGLTLLLVRSTRDTNLQSDEQNAAQLAATAVEQISQFPGDSMLTGRSQAAVAGQWQAAVPGVAPYLAGTQMAWDTTVTGGVTPAVPPELPIAAVQIADPSGAPTKFRKTVYVGVCWQLRAGGQCGVVSPSLQAGRVAMFRVVVAVTWSSPDCRNGPCSFVSVTLSPRTVTDPMFN
jgi:prepilin-type N-terminal cleavage/methylation domain-containing protein